MIDMVLGVIILVSALLGLLRGFVAIVVGALSWLLAGWATFMFGGAAARWLADGKHPSATESFGGYAMVFVGVLISVAVIGMVIRAGVDAIKLGGTDRMLGFGLGVVRGAFLASVLVLLMGFTPLAGMAPVGAAAHAAAGRGLDAGAAAGLANAIDGDAINGTRQLAHGVGEVAFGRR